MRIGRELRLVSAFAFGLIVSRARIATHTLREERGGGGPFIGGLHIHDVVIGLILLPLSGLLE